MLRKLIRLPRKFLVLMTIVLNWIRFRLEGVNLGKRCVLKGRVYVFRRDDAYIGIGSGTVITGGMNINKLSRDSASGLYADSGGKIIIGRNVGMSSSVIWADTLVKIGDFTNIGADCVIMDNDSHSLNPEHRRNYAVDKNNVKSLPVRIGEDVLIGTGCIILKGVSIGDRSIIGAGSVVTSDVPPCEIWAGNPARFIRRCE